MVQTWSFGKEVESQQVGNVWTPGAGGRIVSLSLSGELNVLDEREGGKPAKVLYGRKCPHLRLIRARTFTRFNADEMYDTSIQTRNQSPLCRARVPTHRHSMQAHTMDGSINSTSHLPWESASPWQARAIPMEWSVLR